MALFYCTVTDACIIIMFQQSVIDLAASKKSHLGFSSGHVSKDLLQPFENLAIRPLMLDPLCALSLSLKQKQLEYIQKIQEGGLYQTVVTSSETNNFFKTLQRCHEILSTLPTVQRDRSKSFTTMSDRRRDKKARKIDGFGPHLTTEPSKSCEQFDSGTSKCTQNYIQF